METYRAKAIRLHATRALAIVIGLAFILPILLLSPLAVLGAVNEVLDEPTFKNFIIFVLYAALAGFCLYAFSSNVTELFRAGHFQTRIVPYFESPIGFASTVAKEPEATDGYDQLHPFFKGRQIAVHLAALDKIAAKTEVRTLSSFGFYDDKLGDALRWTEAEAGITTLDVLLQQLKALGENSEDTKIKGRSREMLVQELELLRNCLNRAAELNVRFVLMVRLELEKQLSWSAGRKGYFD